MRNMQFKRVAIKMYTIFAFNRDSLFRNRKLPLSDNLERRDPPGIRHFTFVGLNSTASVLYKHHKFSLAFIDLQPVSVNFPPVC